LLFSCYAQDFGSYNATYGSLGALIGFMFWMWLSATVILVGAELDAEMEHQTARDTTTGAPQSLGGRGATIADTLGGAGMNLGGVGPNMLSVKHTPHEVDLGEHETW
jgi:membrane protein